MKSDGKGKLRRKYNREGWTTWTCECGQVLTSKYKTPGNGVHRLHLRSVRHRNYKRLRAYIDTNCMTLEEMGARLGVSRERVRQIAVQMGGWTGHARQRVCTINRRTEKLEQQISELASTRLGRFIKACGERGLECELEQLGRGEISNRIVNVGEKRVLVKGTQTGWTKNNFVRIVGTSLPVDLIAFELPDGRWLFRAPWFKVSRPGSNPKWFKCSSTMFKLTEVRPGDKGYTLNKSHDHREGIEAWHLLTDNNASN